jgi:3-keto-L-gulonate-6-phosphate decarboxylase
LRASFWAPVVVAEEAAEAGRRAATTGVSEMETMVTMEMAVAGSTVVEAMAEVVAAMVVGEAISRRPNPHRSAEKRFAEL